MWRIVSRASGVVALAGVLGGCGLFQTISDDTRSTARNIFYKQVKTLHLDLSGRSGMNNDLRDMSGLSVPTLVRIYQLRERNALDKASYEELLVDSQGVLGADLLEHRSLMLMPGEGVQFNQPMHQDARYVAVIALFRHPEAQANTWRQVLERQDLDPDRARTLELGDNHLTLRPLTE